MNDMVSIRKMRPCAEARSFSFFALEAGAVAEDQVVLHRVIQRGGKLTVHVLIMGRIDGENRVGGTALEKVRVLLVIHQQKVDVCVFIAGLDSTLHERTISSVQMWAGGMRWNLEEKLCGGGHGKCLVHNGAAGAHRGRSNTIAGMGLSSRRRRF